MDLIGDYGSDDEDRNNSHTTKAKKRLIEIVPSLQVPYDTFVRSVPHTAGNWTGHVYCTIPQVAWTECMEESVRRFQEHLQQDCSFSDLQLISHLDQEIHMSLSRPFVLQLSSISSFVDKLRKRLTQLPSTTLKVNANKEKILVNDEKTRSFWTWPMDANPILLAIVEEINAVLHSYNQPPYYDPPIFHISLASVVGELKTKIKGTSTIKAIAPRALRVHQIHCSFGKTKHFSFDLNDN